MVAASADTSHRKVGSGLNGDRLAGENLFPKGANSPPETGDFWASISTQLC